MTIDPVRSDVQDSEPPLTMSIYQNPDHVAGILQQAHRAPLVTDESREAVEGRTAATETHRTGKASLDVGATIPAFGRAGVTAGGDRGSQTEEGTSADTRSVQNFIYSQAFYLDVVKQSLRARGNIRRVSSIEDAADLRSGDFVEYQARFRPNQMNALLDIMTPDLVAAITFYQSRTEGIRLFDAYSDFEALKVFSLKNETQSQLRSDLARSIAEAIRIDFRSLKTREFYGTIGSGGEEITAVTICDNSHFVVDDEDRILDGVFTVLGKVTSPPELDVPVLNRNKVLERLKPEFIDELFQMLHSSVSEQARKLERRAETHTESEDEEEVLPSVEEPFDLKFDSRIRGASFKVIPVAIYV